MPLATLVSATRCPSVKEDVILSPDGFKRYFVAHGGLFSKDGITLDEIRKIKRIGRQPGTEGLMCTFLFLFIPPVFVRSDSFASSGEVRAFSSSLFEVEC